MLILFQLLGIGRKSSRGVAEHGLFDDAQRAWIFAAERMKQVDRHGGNGILGCRIVDNSEAGGFAAAEPAPGGH